MAVTGTPRVAVTVGTRTRSAALDRTAGPRSSASSLFFKYTVVEEDSDTEGVSIAANAISLNGATITATDDSTDAVLTHPAVPADPTRKVGSGTAPPPSDAPAVSSVFFGSSPAGGDTYERGETIDVPVARASRASAAAPSGSAIGCRRTTATATASASPPERLR